MSTHVVYLLYLLYTLYNVLLIPNISSELKSYETYIKSTPIFRKSKFNSLNKKMNNLLLKRFISFVFPIVFIFCLVGNTDIPYQWNIFFIIYFLLLLSTRYLIECRFKMGIKFRELIYALIRISNFLTLLLFGILNF